MLPGLCGDDVEAPIAAGTMGEWRPRMEELSLEARQCRVGVSGGVEHVALLARIHHKARNWIIQTDVSNAFNSVLRKPMLEQVAACTPALTGFVAKYYGGRPASLFFQMDSGETTKLECSRRVQQGDATSIGPARFCLPLRNNIYCREGPYALPCYSLGVAIYGWTEVWSFLGLLGLSKGG